MRFFLRTIVITLFLSLTIFTTCSLEGDILAQRPKPVEIPPPIIPEPFITAPDTPVIIAFDGFLTVKWNAIEGAEIYEVYLNTDQQPPTLPVKTVAVTTAVLDSLINKTTYYIWIKARDGLYSSDYSPRGIGIPWPTNEKPATPYSPIIIPGINQLTVNWEKCGGAVSYEVYINTSPTNPSAPEIITEKTSAVIKNLENEKIYYLWIQAVNNAGKSDYSPLETGTPKIPTVVPATPAKPVLTVGSRELTVSWQAVELAAAYEIWYGTANNSTQAKKREGDDITGDITETVITRLENETTYYVWIKAKNIVGTSEFSLPANAKPSAFAVLPLVPTTPSTNPGSRTLTVTWSVVEGALSYEVWVGVTDNAVNAEKHGEDVSGTSIMLTDLVNETTYYVWVKAKNAIGISEYSPRASGTPSVFAATPPTPQTAPTVIAGSGQLTISWQTAEGANSYEVWAGTSSNPTLATKRSNDVADLFLVITGLANGTTYYVWIKAKNTVSTSNFSPMASGTPSGFLGIPLPPSIPSISIGTGQIIITWAAVEGATAYEVWIGTVNNSASATKNGVDISTSLSTTISSLTNGTTYYIWIKAKNSYGISGFSPVANGKPVANATAPTLSASNGQLSVTWTAIAGAEQYEVFYGTGINPPQTASQTVTGTSTTISGLVNGTTYNVWINGINSTGTGAMSSAANAKPIGNMGTVTLTTGGSGQLVLNWSTVDGADQYEVYRNTTDSIPTSPSQTVSTTTVTIGSLTNGTTYYVWVKPKNAKGTGNASTLINGKPLGTPGTPVLSFGSEYNQLLVTWTAVAGADEYEVYYGIGTPTTLAATTTGTTTTITGLTYGTIYYVRLQAKNANGVSNYGQTESGTTCSLELYRGVEKICNHNITTALSWISTNAVSGDKFSIILGESDSISPKNLNYSGKTVSITILGYGSERTITLNTNGNMFTVNSNVTLILDENIKLVGINTDSIIYVSGGSLIMNDGSKINGNTNKGQGYGGNGGAVSVDSLGIFTMNGGEISDNKAGDGGGVYINNGTFTMNSGVISNNRPYGGYASYGGGVYVNNSGTFTMNNGVISGNEARDGGGVYVNNGGTFTMNNGVINNNTVKFSNIDSYGGGVYIKKGTFTMNGGLISGNTAIASTNYNSYGGGVFVSINGTFTKSGGGTIYGYINGDSNSNTVKNASGVVLSSRGHAVYVGIDSGYVGTYPAKGRETTAGPGVNMDSSMSGMAGGWEN
jgi:hypothetical protein